MSVPLDHWGRPLACDQCGKQLVHGQRVGRPAKRCSHICAKRAANARLRQNTDRDTRQRDEVDLALVRLATAALR